MGLVNLIMALNPEAIVVGDYLAAGWDLALTQKQLHRLGEMV